MTAAHERPATRYRRARSPESYVGEFNDGPHHFGRATQASAFAHLDRWLRVPGT